jgi:hypothetical protein
VPRTLAAATAARTRSISTAAPFDPVSGITMTISSPPHRATVSAARTVRRHAAAVAQSSASPMR